MSAAAAISLAPAHHGQAVIDGHSPVHFLVGFAAGVMGVDPHLAMVAFVGAKIVDESLRAGTKHAVFGRESGQSLGNELADILFEVTGLHYGKLLRGKLGAPAAAAHGLGIDYHDPRTHRYEDYMLYPRYL
jgi:hypothetical protein